jgi:hypothetical protein
LSPISLQDFLLQYNTNTPPPGTQPTPEPSAAYKAAAAKGQDMFQPMQPLAAGQDPYADIMATWKANTPKNAAGLYVGATGPNGEDMLMGQQGWDNYGRPYFGDGIKGWAVGLMAKLFAPTEKNNLWSLGDQLKDLTSLDMITKEVPNAPGSFSNPMEVNKAMKYAADPTDTVFDMSVINKAAKEGAYGTLPAYAGRVTKAIIEDVVLAGLTAADKVLVEQPLGVVAGLADRMAMPGVDTSKGYLATKEQVDAKTQEQENVLKYIWDVQSKNLKEYVDNSFTITPTGGIPKIAVTPKGPLEADWQAGRILYSSFFEPTLRAEYTRAYLDGADPYLLSQELENPMAEAIVSIAIGLSPFDPLAIMGSVARGYRESSRMFDALKTAVKPVEELAEFFKASDGSYDVAKFADGLDDVKATEKIIDIRNVIANNIKQIGDPSNRGFFSLTATSMRDAIGKQTGDFMSWAVHNTVSGEGMDAKTEALKYLSYLGSGDAEKVTEALGYLKGSAVKNPGAFLSPTGFRTGVILNSMLGEGDNLIKEFQAAQKLSQETGDLKYIIELAMKKQTKALAELIPDTTAALKAGIEVSPLQASVARVDKFVKKWVYNPANTFFSTFYMGLSSGYALRNYITNSLHVAVDEGVGALMQNGAQLSKKIDSLLGGVSPSSVHGITSKGTMGMDTATWSQKLPFSRLSNWFETRGAMQVTYSSIRRTLNTALQEGRAIPSVTDLVGVGLNKSAANRLINLVIANDGDVMKATKLFRTELDNELVPLFRTLEDLGLTRGELDALAKDGYKPLFQDALTNGATREDVIRAWDDVIAGLSNEARKMVQTEADLHIINPTDGPEANGIIDMIENSGDATTYEFKALIAHYMNANKATFKEFDIRADAYFKSAIARARKIDPSKVDVIQTAQKEWQAIRAGIGSENPANTILGKMGVPAHMNVFTSDWKPRIDIYKQQYLDGKLTDFTNTWDTLVGDIKAKYPDVVKDLPKLTDNTWDGFRTAFWNDFFFPYQRTIWNGYRDSLYTNTERIFNDVNALLPANQAMRTSFQTNLDAINEAYQNAVVYDKYLDPRIVADKIYKAMESKDLARIEEVMQSVGVDAHEAFPLLYGETPNFKVTGAVKKAINEAAGIAQPARAVSPADMMQEKANIIESYFNQTRGGHTLTWMNENMSQDGLKLLKYDSSNAGSIEQEFAQIGITKRVDDMTSQELVDNLVKYNEDYLARVSKGEVTPYAKKIGTGARDTIESTEPFKPPKINIRATANVLDDAPLPAYMEGLPPTPGRGTVENLKGLTALKAKMEIALNERWGTTQKVVKNTGIESELKKWEELGTARVSQARLMAMNVAAEARNFTLLNYGGKRVSDLALGYIMPYSFWYTRTYANWLQRIVYNPEVIASYAKYKEALSKIHAGAPNWYKYQVNSNELLGMDSDHPLFFNLEQTINPLNGLVGTDFNDPEKRVDGLSRFVDDLGKLGPSVWTPYGLALATKYAMAGEMDASARWAGRLIPQTSLIKSILDLSGAKIKTRGGFNEFDPAVQIFSNGMTPYERNQMARSIGMMVEDGTIDEATGIDIGNQQENHPLWEQVYGVTRLGTGSYYTSRAFSQLMGSTIGVGFKGRSLSDIQIDRYYTDRNRLWDMRPNMTPDEWRNAMGSLKNAYPFADVIELARKGGAERDTALAYNVLSRIQPGASDNYFEAVNVSPELYSKFWESKGDIGSWNQADQMQFMGGVLKLSAILDMPNEATKTEWNTVKNMYAGMNVEAGKLFGGDIITKVDAYWASKNAGDTKEAEAILARSPEIEQYWDWKSSYLLNDPMLSKYYASLGTVEDYYKGLVSNAISSKLGKDIFAKSAMYTDMKNGKVEGDYKAYLKEHPELLQYWDMNQAYKTQTAQMFIQIGKILPKAPGPNIRPGAEGATDFQQTLKDQEEAKPPAYDYTWADFKELVDAPLERLLIDHFDNGDYLSSAANDELYKLADELGIEYYVLLELMRNSRVKE